MSELDKALQALQGKPLAPSDWQVIDQARINQFAEATGDFQWIHVDVERAARELPGGKTIAHGFLTLSLTAGCLAKAINLPGLKSSMNYGLNKVRFLAPVAEGSRVRCHFVLAGYESTAKGYLTVWHASVEVEGQEKAACVAEALALLQGE